MAPALQARASLQLEHVHRHGLRESVEFARLLALDTAQVERVVAAELATNPALVASGTRRCVGCGAVTHATWCRSCRPGTWTVEPPEPRPALRQLILADLLVACTGPNERRVAHHLVAALDRSGFLHVDAASIALDAACTPDVVERVRRHLVELGPPGIAARDVRERLLALVEAAEAPVAVHDLVEHHLAALGGADDGTDPVRVDEALTWLRRHLEARIDLDESDEAPDRSLADVVVVEHDGGFSVEPSGLSVPVEVDAEYVAEVRTFEAGMSEDERRRARDQILRATELAERLAGRTRTIVRVTEAAVARQEGLLRHGETAQQPLTRAEVAQALGLHQSTVSRAVAGTTVQLPDRSVRPLSSLFGGHHALLAELAALMVDHPGAPDRVLGELLAGRGHHVARRTVSKYRHELAKQASPASPPART